MKVNFYPEAQKKFVARLPPNTQELITSLLKALSELNEEEEITSNRKWFVGYETS